MKHDVNYALFGLLLITIISMLVLGLYYRATYVRLNSRYQQAISEVNAVATDLNQTMSEVNAKEELLNKKERELLDYINELNISKSRESSLGEHFTELRGEKEELETDLTDAVTDRDEWKTSYYGAKQDLDVCEVDRKTKETLLKRATTEVERVQSITEGIKPKSSELGTVLADMDSKLNDIDDTADDMNIEITKIEEDERRESLDGQVNDLQADINRLDKKMDELQSIVNSIISKIEEL